LRLAAGCLSLKAKAWQALWCGTSGFVVQCLEGCLRSKLTTPLTPQYNSAPRNPKHHGSALLPLCISHACIPLHTNTAIEATIHQHAQEEREHQNDTQHMQLQHHPAKGGKICWQCIALLPAHAQLQAQSSHIKCTVVTTPRQ
jgi:hypothetical protein